MKAAWPKGLIFDLDGTLVDSAGDVAAVLNAVLAEDGALCLSEEHRTLPAHGRGLDRARTAADLDRRLHQQGRGASPLDPRENRPCRPRICACRRRHSPKVPRRPHRRRSYLTSSVIFRELRSCRRGRSGDAAAATSLPRFGRARVSGVLRDGPIATVALVYRAALRYGRGRVKQEAQCNRARSI
jgi:hypothetical protein